MDSSSQINIEYLFLKTYELITGGWGDWFSAPLFSARTILIIKIVSVIISWGLMITLALVANKLWKLRREQRGHLLGRLTERMDTANVQNQHWTEILRLVDSNNENDWIKAVIEADKMLDDVVTSMNLPGESLGERMKNIEPADFPVLQDAWDAHKVRNRIAHEPGFKLTDREVGRVIGLYGKVFRSVKYI